MERTKSQNKKMSLGDVGVILRQEYIDQASKKLDQQIMKQKNIHILANDPSICAWGYSVLDQNGNVLEIGCIKTESGGKKMRIRKGDDSIRRIKEITTRLLTVIKKHDIEYIVSELPHGSQSASAAVMIGVCMGIMQTLADTLDIGIEWFSEGDSKKNALGKLSAEKKEMITAMSKQYQVKWTGTKYIDEAVADSLAIHNVASKQSPALKLFRS